MLRKIFFYPALFIFCWLYSMNFNDIDWDLWARMTVGKIFFQTGGVLHNDIFSYTVTKEWIDHEWGSGVIFYFLSDKFGDYGLLALKVVLYFTIVFLITRIIKLYNPCEAGVKKTETKSFRFFHSFQKPGAHQNIIFYFFVIVPLFFNLGQTVRCQLFTFTFFTLWLYVLERVRRGENRLLWIMPVTALIWANFHGGFVAGLGLLFIYGVGEFLNRKPFVKYFITAISSLLVTLINPYGFKYLQYIFYAVTMNRSAIGEWGKPDLLRSWSTWYSFKIVIAMAVISIVFYLIKNKPKWNEIDKVKYGVILVMAYLGLSHIKHMAFFVIAASSFLYHDFYAIFDEIGRFIKAKTGEIGTKTLRVLDIGKNTILYIFILGAGILLMAFNPLMIRVPFNKYPVGSVEFIRQNDLKGHITSVFHWGSYIAWKLYPNCFISMDGRFEEVYPENTFFLTSAFIGHQSRPERNFYWDEFLKRYSTTDIIIAGKDNEPRLEAYNALKKMEEWEMVFEGPISAVFVRKNKVKDQYIKSDFNLENYNPIEITKDKYKTNIDFSGKEKSN